ncbi:MAG: OPT family oligopeptide transporter [Gemmatimonadetes bacterium]|nr:OPT family oligopeptide transporter [Gemmatimonadota bacterium]NIO31310.1 OPT family oligopeptide transporter [Gemmatimonadota bacterium]
MPGKPPQSTTAEGEHPSAREPLTLFLALIVSLVGAIIGLQIITSLGVTPNTSIVAVIIAILVSRVPLRLFRGFRSVHRQNLIQTTMSSATFGAANSLLVPIGVPILVGRPELVVPMLLGATAGMLIDVAMLYWLFDSRLFPGASPWPIGIASAEAILAGDRGGRRGRLLGVGAVAGVLGTSGLFGGLRAALGVAALPMAAFGIAFLGNVWALAMFGVGLLVRGYAPGAWGIDLEAQLVPHGMMIGAGIMALGQAVFIALRRRAEGDNGGSDRAARSVQLTRNREGARAGLLRGAGLYLLASALLAVGGGLWAEMGAPQLLGWVVFAAVACVAAEFIVGLAAMQAGWFPAFATALVFLLLGLFLGFPPAAAALMVGFVASGGPAFADAGYDFKTGWYLRGFGRDAEFELAGRRQQLFAALVGLLTALAVVALFHRSYFEADLFPPVVRVYAAAIEAGIDPQAGARLLAWAVLGALLQLLGGPSRQLGILFATGLLIFNPLAGWAVLLGLLVRVVWARGGTAVEGAPSTVFAGGLIAGDALWSFGASLFR